MTDIRYIEIAKSCGVYGTDHLGDLLEFAYAIAAEERNRLAHPTCQENRHVADNATTEPEPFAWCHEKAGGYRSYFWNQQYPDDIPLYTAPPKREWVGLTDEEVEEIVVSDCNMEEYFSSAFKLSRQVEAKLKEKNT